MKSATRPGNRPLRYRGSVLVEGLMAVLVFSVALVALLLLLSSALRESGNAYLRSHASLLATELIERMWHGDRSLAGLQSRFADTEESEYAQWLADAKRELPGIRADALRPQLTIGADRSVTLVLHWQSPGDADAHQLVMHTRITD